MYDFRIKQGSRDPVIRVQIKNGNGSLPDLTGYSVAFRMRLQEAAELTIDDAAGTLVDGPEAVVEYSWGATDLDVDGYHDAEFICTKDGRPMITRTLVVWVEPRV